MRSSENPADFSKQSQNSISNNKNITQPARCRISYRTWYNPDIQNTPEFIASFGGCATLAFANIGSDITLVHGKNRWRCIALQYPEGLVILLIPSFQLHGWYTIVPHNYPRLSKTFSHIQKCRGDCRSSALWYHQSALFDSSAPSFFEQLPDRFTSAQ